MPRSPFRRFSDGYYVGRLRVERRDGDRAAMERGQHRAANEQVYATGEGVERLDHPLVAKVDGSHFPVTAEADRPAGTLGLPADLLAAAGIGDPPTATAVLVATADRAGRLLRWFVPGAWSAPADAYA
ncbi:MAG: DUF5802 family protein [Haloferacaceae archaeon]